MSTIASSANDALSIINGASNGSSDTSSASGTSSGTDIGNQFLTLLVTQLQNQDPLNPMDNSQMTSQLAQISTVTGINTLNATMSSLAASLGSNQYMQAAGLVGHTVLAPGSKIDLTSGAGGAGFTLAQNADDVKVTVTDASGSIVRQMDLGAQNAGTQTFAWDGKTDTGTTAADGQYSFTLSATASGNTITPDALMSGHVDGVVLGTGGTTLLQLGALGRVDLSTVVEIN
jgi:flagellar basal-body rod modification protein FlgD